MQITCLHILPDDIKHVANIIKMFRCASPDCCRNEYIILKDNITEPNTTTISGTPVKLYPNNSQFISGKVSESKYIFIHFLGKTQQEIVVKAPMNIIFIWVLWGWDFYCCHPKIKNKLFEQETRKFINRNYNLFYDYNGIVARNLKIVPHLYRLYLSLRSFPENIRQGRHYLNAFNRINFISCFQEEFDYIKEVTNTNAKGINFYFNSLNEYFPESIDFSQHSCGTNIILGNSATLENNHLDIFKSISLLPGINEKKILLPLTYGHTQYGQLVIENGQKLFNKNIIALTEFLPRNKYIEKLGSCNIMIMNHVRQQAIGNIITGLYLGMKVYINKKSPVFKLLYNKKIIFYTVQDDLVPENTAALSSLPKAAIEHNRQIIEKYWNKDAVYKLIENIYRTAIPDNII